MIVPILIIIVGLSVSIVSLMVAPYVPPYNNFTNGVVHVMFYIGLGTALFWIYSGISLIRDRLECRKLKKEFREIESFFKKK